jgi:recombinational DNA repair protein (RecF pathway)
METLKALEHFTKNSASFYEQLKTTLHAHEALSTTMEALSEALVEARKALGVDDRCQICCVGQKTMALVDCGHVLCISCTVKSIRQGRCPFCRKHTTTPALKVYI